ncbi:hypothetical protein [Nitrincola iocasae]|uniref:Cxxc_20_cxxc protein n=1 Tax=Nitrincola iocasae TaxID=2614693 RepID=A0A5J6LCV2_9GAMM|nr:hypothetical protein [Nitrincola iocasae]QEW06052.1 hypothetical protein F5I99_05825 [Nitrincola iocasae]
MIRKKCPGCGAKTAFFKSVFASRSFPFTCRYCGEKQFRRHDFTKLLAYFGASIGLFALLFLFMTKGLQIAIILLFGFLCLLFLAYVSELFIFDLSGYGDQEKNRVAIQSKRNIWITIVVIFLGVIFYFFDL